MSEKNFTTSTVLSSGSKEVNSWEHPCKQGLMFQVYEPNSLYLSESSSANHLQGLKVLQTQSGPFQTQELRLFPRMLRTPNAFLQGTKTTKNISSHVFTVQKYSADC